MSETEYFENPFKVCSDEWCDRSLINSVIWTTTIEIELNTQTIKNDETYISKDIDRGFYPNPICEQVERSIEKRRREVSKMKEQLRILKSDELMDKQKIERYWALENR